MCCGSRRQIRHQLLHADQDGDEPLAEGGRGGDEGLDRHAHAVVTPPRKIRKRERKIRWITMPQRRTVNLHIAR